MAQKLVRVMVAVLFAAGAFVVVGGGATTAQDKKAPSIGEIMRAGHGKTDPLLGKVIAGAKGGKWEDATAAAKSLDENAAMLSKGTPKRDEGKTWEKLSTNYHKNTSALLAATEKKDAEATKEAVGTLTSSCMECHKAHKGGKK
jgi:cytochrome c556